MKRLKALKNVWIRIEKEQDGIWLYTSEMPLFMPLHSDTTTVIRLQAGDELSFENVTDGDNPCQMLLDKYPECFALGNYAP